LVDKDVQPNPQENIYSKINDALQAAREIRKMNDTQHICIKISNNIFEE